jgi:hypothetical protein
MEDVVVKFAGGQCSAIACGSQNPVAAMMAQMLLSGPDLAVSQAQEASAQSVGNAATIASGGVGF